MEECEKLLKLNEHMSELLKEIRESLKKPQPPPPEPSTTDTYETYDEEEEEIRQLVDRRKQLEFQAQIDAQIERRKQELEAYRIMMEERRKRLH